MAVTIHIELESLRKPAVARAVSQLVEALAEFRAESAAARTPTSQSKPRRTRAPAQATGGDNYDDFVASLPERSRKFLSLVREHGTLTIEDAMSALEVSVPKAMGGITGSIGRWAPARGIALPYERVKLNGKRGWRWLGTSDEGAAPSPSVAQGSITPTQRKKPAPKRQRYSRDPVKRYGQFVAELPERSQKFLALLEEESTLTMSQAMQSLGVSVPKAMGGITGSIARWAPTRKVALPYKSTKVNGERGWEWLGRPSAGDDAPKADAPEEPVQGRASAGAKSKKVAIDKKASAKAKADTTKKAAAKPKADTTKKAAAKPKADTTKKAAAKPKADKTKTVSRKASAPARKKPGKKKEEQAKAAPPVETGPRVATVKDLERLTPTMDTRPARLVALLQDRGQVGQDEVLSELGLSAARHVAPILDAVGQACSAEGFESPIRRGFSDDGVATLYTWKEVYDAIKATEVIAESKANELPKASKSAFGVKVRRRRK